jgi:hypothetical protein
MYAVIKAQNGRGRPIRIDTYSASIEAAKLFTEKSAS